MFNIAFVPGMRNENSYELGQMMLGASRQGFRSGTSYWSMAQYEQHWHDAILRLVDGAECSALITDLPPSSLVNHLINWWPMWQKDGTVYVQERLLIRSNLKGVFDPSNPHRHIGSRDAEEDNAEENDGFRNSEWTVPLQDFVEFLQNTP